MTLLKTCLRVALLCPLALVWPETAAAQSIQWQVVTGESAAVQTPNLPAGSSRSFSGIALGDAGGSQVGFWLNSPSLHSGYWASSGSGFVRYAALGSSGNLGPGRIGAEAGHSFLSFATDTGDSAVDGQRVFLARAGDAAATNDASYGLWRWDGARNIEVARGSVDTLLGPGLGAGWVFPNQGSFAGARMLNNGQVLGVANVTSPTGVASKIVFRHVPGQGNQPCMRVGATEPALAPGVVPGESFSTFSDGISRVAQTSSGRIFSEFAFGASNLGLFELCNGAPRAIAVRNETGARGPQIDDSGATFTDYYSLQPTGPQSLIYFASFRRSTSAIRSGLFHYDGSRHLGIAYTEASGQVGPNWQNASWNNFDTGSLTVAGDYAAFTALINTPDGGSQTGLWRLRVGESPELVALLNLVSAPYAPEPGRTWRLFHSLAILGNGDIVLYAQTNPNSTNDLWLLPRGQAPRRVLSAGQTVNVPTAQGPVATTITSFSVPDGGAQFTGGRDGWMGADGSLLLSAQATGFGRVYLRTRFAVPDPAQVFGNGFE